MKFPAGITSEFFEYTTHLSLDQFKTEIQNLIKETQNLGFSVNLTGKVLNENEFYITSKWNFGPLVSGPVSYLHHSDPTNLRIFTYQNENKETQVNLLVTPNSYYPLLFILCPISLLILWFCTNESGSAGVYAIILFLAFLIPIITVIISKILKRKLKDKFVKYFDLKKMPS